MDPTCNESMFSSDLVKNVMKKRLLNWGTLFEKYQSMGDDDELDSNGAYSDVDEVDISSELRAVSDEHSEVRKTICSEIGLTEEELEKSSKKTKQSPIKVAKRSKNVKHKVHQGDGELSKNHFEITYKSDKKRPPDSENDKRPSKESVSDDCFETTKTIEDPDQSASSEDEIFETRKVRESMMSFSTNSDKCTSSSKLDESKPRKIRKELCGSVLESSRKVVNLRKHDISEDKANTTKQLCGGVFKSSRKIVNLRKNDFSEDKAKTTNETYGKKEHKRKLVISDLKQSETYIKKLAGQWQSGPSEIGEPAQLASPPKSLGRDKNISEDSNVSPRPSFEDMRALVEQYELWKLYQRRKSGQFGSLFIVSDLDEAPSEENRFKPDLPSEMEKPVLVTKRRFSLKKSLW